MNPMEPAQMALAGAEGLVKKSFAFADAGADQVWNYGAQAGNGVNGVVDIAEKGVKDTVAFGQAAMKTMANGTQDALRQVATDAQAFSQDTAKFTIDSSVRFINYSIRTMRAIFGKVLDFMDGFTDKVVATNQLGMMGVQHAAGVILSFQQEVIVDIFHVVGNACVQAFNQRGQFTSQLSQAVPVPPQVISVIDTTLNSLGDLAKFLTGAGPKAAKQVYGMLGDVLPQSFAFVDMVIQFLIGAAKNVMGMVRQGSTKGFDLADEQVKNVAGAASGVVNAAFSTSGEIVNGGFGLISTMQGIVEAMVDNVYKSLMTGSQGIVTGVLDILRGVLAFLRQVQINTSKTAVSIVSNSLGQASQMVTRIGGGAKQ